MSRGVAEIDVDSLLDASLKDPSSLDAAMHQTQQHHQQLSYDERESRDSERDKDRKRRRSRSGSRDRKDKYSRDKGDRSPRHNSSRRRSRSRDRDRRSRSKDRDHRSSRRNSSSSSRDPERDRERDAERDRRRRDDERARERQKELLLDPSERIAIESERDARTVFAFNLPLRAYEGDLVKFFERAGKVRDVKLITDRNSRKSKGVGYVEFVDKISVPAALALSGTQLMGQTIQVQQTHAEKNRMAATATTITQTNRENTSSHTRLYVGSLHLNVTEDDIRKLFNPFGEIEFVNLHTDQDTGKSKGFGFVQFKKPDEAKKAYHHVNGREMAGKIIRVGIVNENNKVDTQAMMNGTYNGPAPPTLAHLDDDDDRGLKLNSASRAILMQRLQRNSNHRDDDLPPPPPKETAPLPSEIPSTCIVLKNMFDPQAETDPNWDIEIRDDVREECSKFGSVIHIYVNRESQGYVYMRFGSIPGAQNAYNSLNGRWFAGRMIDAEYIPESTYLHRFPDAN